MKNAAAQSVGDSAEVWVGCEKEGRKVKGMKGGLPFLVVLLFCVALWQCRSLTQLLPSLSLKPALSSGPAVGFSLPIYQKTQEEKVVCELKCHSAKSDEQQRLLRTGYVGRERSRTNSSVAALGLFHCTLGVYTLYFLFVYY